MMLILLGMGIGLFSLGHVTGDDPFGELGLGSAIWWVLSWIVGLFCGGWLTARFAGLQRRHDGALHGMVTWAVTFLVSLVLMTSVLGAVIGGTFGILGSALSTAGDLAKSAPEAAGFITGEDEPLQNVMDEARDIMAQVRARGGDQAVDDLTTTIRQVFRKPEVTPADRQRVVDLLTRNTDLSQQEARQATDRWATVYADVRGGVEDLVGKVPDAIESVSDALAGAAIWSFLTQLLGIVAAALGGMVGRVGREVVV
ncbi:MAG: hypothetical protein R6X25_02595 [Candidatus Krumholzibacteriia bacterium]